MFKISDFYGIIAAMLTLILVFLILNNGMSFKQILGATFEGSNSLAKTLQGR